MPCVAGADDEVRTLLLPCRLEIDDVSTDRGQFGRTLGRTTVEETGPEASGIIIDTDAKVRCQ
jgi:hypothetical protein